MTLPAPHKLQEGGIAYAQSLPPESFALSEIPHLRQHRFSTECGLARLYRDGAAGIRGRSPRELMELCGWNITAISSAKGYDAMVGIGGSRRGGGTIAGRLDFLPDKT